MLFAALASGGVAGGVIYGMRTWSGSVVRRWLTITAVFTLVLATVPAASSVWMLGGSLILAGALLSPIVACAYQLLDVVMLSGTAMEAFAWLATAYAVGSALGAGAAGLIIEAGGPSVALTAPVLGSTVALVYAIARRRTLVAPADRTESREVVVAQVQADPT